MPSASIRLIRKKARYSAWGSSSGRGASDTARADGDVIVPEGIRVSSVRLPAKVDSADLGLDATPLPLGGVGVGHTGLAGETGDGFAVQPCLDGAIGAQVVLEALPTAGGKGSGGGDTLGRQVGQGGIVRFTIVHQDLALAADPEVFIGSLGGVGHGDEGDVRVCQGLGCLAEGVED
jgi:hypothetical protein